MERWIWVIHFHSQPPEQTSEWLDWAKGSASFVPIASVAKLSTSTPPLLVVGFWHPDLHWAVDPEPDLCTLNSSPAQELWPTIPPHRWGTERDKESDFVEWPLDFPPSSHAQRELDRACSPCDLVALNMLQVAPNIGESAWN